MTCPSCGAGGEFLWVTDSRHTALGTVRRRRRCGQCEHAFRTVEEIAGRGVQFEAGKVAERRRVIKLIKGEQP